MEPVGSQQSLELKKITQDVKQTPFFKEIFNVLLQLSNEYPSAKKKDGGTSPENFHVVRRKYANIAVLNEIVNMSLAFISSSNPRNRTTENENILKELSEASALIDLQSCIQSLNDSNKINGEEVHVQTLNSNLFEIDVKSLRSRALSLLSNRHKEVLRNRVQHVINERCNQIISFTFPDEAFSSPSEGMASVVRHVAELKKNVDSERIMITKQRQYNSALMKLISQQLIEYGNALESLVRKHRFSTHPLPHLEFFSTSNKTYLLKLRCLEMEAMTSTYNKATIPALKKLRQVIDSAHEVTLKELAQVQHRLSAYEGLDPKFHELLKEYVSLQKDIQFLKV